MNIHCGNNINVPPTYDLNDIYQPNGNIAEQCSFDCAGRWCSNIQMFCNSNNCNIIEGNSPNSVIMVTPNPTLSPTFNPTITPSISPTSNPTITPTNQPSNTPTITPSNVPTNSPTNLPTNIPSLYPTVTPTKEPILNPTTSPSINPTGMPTSSPTSDPTGLPTNLPSLYPSITPTKSPTKTPTEVPSLAPTQQARINSFTIYPSTSPTYEPTIYPSRMPTNNIITPLGSISPTLEPTNAPNISFKISEEPFVDAFQNYVQFIIIGIAFLLVIIWILIYILLRKKRKLIKEVESLNLARKQSVMSRSAMSRSIGSMPSVNESNKIYLSDNESIKAVQFTRGYDSNNVYTQWTKMEFIDWISQLKDGKMEKYRDILTKKFTKYNIDGSNIMSIKRRDWIDMFGIHNFADMNVIHTSIEELINKSDTKLNVNFSSMRTGSIVSTVIEGTYIFIYLNT